MDRTWTHSPERKPHDPDRCFPLRGSLTPTAARQNDVAPGRVAGARESGFCRAAHVLMTFEADEQLVGPHRTLDLLAEPDGVADIEFVAPKIAGPARPASFD